MDATTNALAYELGKLRLAQRRQPNPETATRIAAIEAELERVNFQFHSVTVRG